MPTHKDVGTRETEETRYLEYPRRSQGRPRGRLDAVSRPLEQALRGETHAAQRLRGSLVPPPEPPQLPRPEAAGGVTRRLHRDPPVEAVTPEVEEPPARVPVVLQRVQALLGVILRMCARGHRLVPLQHIRALVVQLVVRHHVVTNALCLQPRPQVTVSLEVAHPRAPPRLGDGHKAALEREQRAAVGGVGHAGPVRVRVVGGGAVRSAVVRRVVPVRPRPRACAVFSRHGLAWLCPYAPGHVPATAVGASRRSRKRVR
eukprot:1196409-Prorocentrum_minimum.AAC.8